MLRTCRRHGSKDEAATMHFCWFRPGEGHALTWTWHPSGCAARTWRICEAVHRLSAQYHSQGVSMILQAATFNRCGTSSVCREDLLDKRSASAYRRGGRRGFWSRGRGDVRAAMVLLKYPLPELGRVQGSVLPPPCRMLSPASSLREYPALLAAWGTASQSFSDLLLNGHAEPRIRVGLCRQSFWTVGWTCRPSA